MSDNSDDEKNREFLALQTRKRSWTYAANTKKISIIIAFGLFTITSYASDAHIVREIQLMLSLKGYDLSYGDSKGIDGKLGSETRAAIIDYQKKKHLTPTGIADKWLYNSLFEDTKSKSLLPPEEVEKNKDKDHSDQKPEDSKKEKSPDPILTEVLASGIGSGHAMEMLKNHAEMLGIVYGASSALFAVILSIAAWFGIGRIADIKKELSESLAIQLEAMRREANLAHGQVTQVFGWYKEGEERMRNFTDTWSGRLQDNMTTYTDTKVAIEKLTEQFREKTVDIETIKDQTKRNFEALALASSAYLTVTYCIGQLGQTVDAAIITKLKAGLGSALIATNDIIDKYKPTDNIILAWAFTIRGTVLHLQDRYEPALRDFERALEISPERSGTLYNAGCSACRLALKEKALSYIKRAIQIDPGRRDEAKNDIDLKPIWNDI